MRTEDLYTIYRENRKVSIDTRTIVPGSLFFAIKGERFDGNNFVSEALEKGASLAIADDVQLQARERLVHVPDVLQTLQELAQFHRSRLKIPIIGVTGSNGKTTTKELIRAVLDRRFRTFATRGNLNNHLGVPLSILEVDDALEIAVIEMGANHLGEIARLCEIAGPTHGLITNIGKAHIGTFGSADNILRGKSELFQYLLDHKGAVWINSTEVALKNMGRRFRDPMFYPDPGDFYHCSLIGADPYLTVRAENEDVFKTNLIGEYNFANIAAALCIAKYFGVDPASANDAVAKYLPGNMRSEVIRQGTNTILLDAYNANPSSMKAAIESFAALDNPNKVLILGDMFELGTETEREHFELGDTINKSGAGTVFLCGIAMATTAKVAKGAQWFSTREKLAEYLQAHRIQNAAILIKGSRGMQLEQLTKHI